MSQHTPGPWTLEYESGQYFFLAAPDSHPIMRQRGGMLPTRHDARLIAAAPEMLAFIRQYSRETHADDCAATFARTGRKRAACDCGRDEARALLAKIEGARP